MDGEVSHTHTSCPAPHAFCRKVAHVLDELNLTYETKYLDFGKNEQKGPEHTHFNPNGRIPTLIDHGNNDFVLWYVIAIL